MEPDLSDVRALIEEFVAFLREDLRGFSVSLIWDSRCDVEWKTQRKSIAHIINGAGVYLVYADDARLAYIGKASMNSILDKRVWTHDDDCRSRGCAPRWHFAIPMPAHVAFLAPALEEFLVSRLNPPVNRIGRSGR